MLHKVIETPRDDELSRIQKNFGIDGFKQGQRQIICDVLDGKDVIASMPTGGGKSLCFQGPASIEKKPSLIISPLIALMEDQLGSLAEVGVPAYAIHSGIDEAEKLARFQGLREGLARLLYVSPELLATSGFYNEVYGVPFQRIAVDEAHCASTWGPSFRPEFMRIGNAAKKLMVRQKIALSATIDDKIEKDIARYTGMFSGSYERISIEPYRENLYFSIVKINPKLREKALLYTKVSHIYAEVNKLKKGATIVYCRTVDEAYEIYSMMRGNKKNDVYLFHARLPLSDKDEALQAFSENDKPIVIATSAFGMGIDRADVRLVFQASTPYSLIDFYQAAGRAGRDGKSAKIITLYQKDKYEWEVRHRLFGYPSIEFVERIYEWFKKSIQSNGGGADYTIATFMRRVEGAVKHSDKIKKPEEYLQKVKLSLHILESAGVIEEHPSGVKFTPFLLGGETHKRLIEITQMEQRAEVRNNEMMKDYFEGKDVSQRRLLEILDM